MSRNRAQARTIARVEALEGRQLMAFDAFIHFGPLTGAALVDLNHGSTPAAHGWEEIYSFSWGASSSVGGKVSVSSFNFMMKASPPLVLLR